MSIEWSLHPLQMKMTGLPTMDLEYGQTRSLDELLRDVRFQQESVTKWMLLNLGLQNAVAYAGKRVTPDEDVQPYNLHPLTQLAKTANFRLLLMF